MIATGLELSGSGFESSCNHFTFRFRTCFEQGVPWHSGNYRVWIHSETRTWHDKNIQSFRNNMKNLWIVYNSEEVHYLIKLKVLSKTNSYADIFKNVSNCFFYVVLVTVKKLGSRLWPILFTLTHIFLIHNQYSLLLENKNIP